MIADHNMVVAGAAAWAKAALEEAAFAPPGVMNTLAAITAMPAGPGFDALMQLVEQRAQVLSNAAAVLLYSYKAES